MGELAWNYRAKRSLTLAGKLFFGGISSSQIVLNCSVVKKTFTFILFYFSVWTRLWQGQASLFKRNWRLLQQIFAARTGHDVQSKEHDGRDELHIEEKDSIALVSVSLVADTSSASLSGCFFENLAASPIHAHYFILSRVRSEFQFLKVSVVHLSWFQGQFNNMFSSFLFLAFLLAKVMPL